MRLIGIALATALTLSVNPSFAATASRAAAKWVLIVQSVNQSGGSTTLHEVGSFTTTEHCRSAANSFAGIAGDPGKTSIGLYCVAGNDEAAAEAAKAAPK